MSESIKEVFMRIAHKHDIEANWLKASDFIPLQGELIVYDCEVDANGNTLELPNDRTIPYNYVRFKVGDGQTLINDLPYFLQSQTDRIQELEDKQIDTVFTKEEVMIDSSQWSIIDGYAEPYIYSTIVQLSSLNLESESVELINNQPILFAKYGFVIATIHEGTKVEIYALELPIDIVTLTFEVRNLVHLYGDNDDNN